MDFLKAHGTGNDFVVLVDPDDRIDLPAPLVRALCDRHRGLGADGVIRIGAPRTGGQVFMDYRNADGGAVEMCGNGVRVVAAVALERGLVDGDAAEVAVDTRDGVKAVTVARDDGGAPVAFTVDMGPPYHESARIPVVLPDDGSVEAFTLRGREWTALSMGNPHAVTVVDDVATAPVTTLGPDMETDPAFPNRTNVEFAHVVDPATVDLRVWERGVGETQACGTGACAALVALRQHGLVGDAATIRLPGGELTVRYAPDEHPSVFLTGPAEIVARGRIDARWLDARRG